MLGKSIGWCGKLPTQPDFIQSHYFPVIEKKLMDWIATGQDHIGQQLVKTDDINRSVYFYYFYNKKLSQDGYAIRGLLFNSQDQRGRVCPFILFSLDQHSDLKTIFTIFFRVIQQLDFNFNMLNPKLNQQQLLDELMRSIDQLDISQQQVQQNDYWLELYPEISKLELSVATTNHIVFRKLMLR